MWIPKNRQDFRRHLNDPLFKNSYYLMATMLFTAGAGFFFWIFAARLYTVEAVGLGSAILSATWLLSILSVLGFDIGLIRYLPEERDKSRMINSCFTMTALAALMLAVIFILGLQIWTPALMILREQTVFGAVFVLFTIAMTLFGLQTNVFVAFRQAKYSFIQGSVAMLRIVILPFLVAFGAFGLYLSAGLATIIAILVGNMLIMKVLSTYRLVPAISKKMLSGMVYYSFGNNVANIFYFLPVAALPLLVVDVLGEEHNAYFYVAWAISSVLLMIPFTVSTSLFAEGSFSPDELRRNVIKSLKFIYVLLILGIIGLFIFGRYVLLLFGEAYAENAFGVLLILSLASIPHAINVVYVAIKRVKKETMPAIYVYGTVAALTLIGSYIAIQEMGLIGIGISWIAGNGIMAVAVGIKMIVYVYSLRIPMPS
jgi:O-antigen/teichoic acid export membrane protein